MTIEKIKNDKALELKLAGRLDTITAPQLEETLRDNLSGVTALTIDMEKLEYVSSAGLRVLLTAQKTMSRQGAMVVKHVAPSIMEVFEMTGFVDILTIE